MTSNKISVFVVGATGSTGGSIANALLAQPDVFHVTVAIRPSSLSKPSVVSLVSQGADVRPLDLELAPKQDELVSLLKDVDTVISTLYYDKLQLQYPLIDAAVRAGVKRFVPSDWSPVCVAGLRKLHDEKLAIREYIKKSGLGYTFIDAGYWATLPPADAAESQLKEPSAYKLSLQVFGTGDVPCAIIHVDDIGLLVARILQDDTSRTLNKYFFLYSEEVTQKAVFALASRVSGKEFHPLHVSEEEIHALVKKSDTAFELAVWEYVVSIWIRGDDTMENAKKPEYGGALDAREMYPKVKLRTLEEYARQFYGVSV